MIYTHCVLPSYLLIIILLTKWIKCWKSCDNSFLKVVLFRLLSVGRKISASKNLCALGIDCALLTRMHHRMPVPQVEINKRERRKERKWKKKKKIWEIFLLLQLDLILSGYVKNASEDVQLVKKLFHILPDLPESQAPGIREWQIVLSLLRKALEVCILIPHSKLDWCTM